MQVYPLHRFEIATVELGEDVERDPTMSADADERVPHLVERQALRQLGLVFDAYLDVLNHEKLISDEKTREIRSWAEQERGSFTGEQWMGYHQELADRGNMRARLDWLCRHGVKVGY